MRHVPLIPLARDADVAAMPRAGAPIVPLPRADAGTFFDLKDPRMHAPA